MSDDRFKYGDPRNRPFTVFAAKMFGKDNLLMAGRCPFCSNEIGPFRDELSKKEFSISGICQKCQDETFKKRDES